MKAVIIDEDGLQVKDVEKPQVEVGRAIVKISAAALNRRDQWIREGLYPKIELPVLPGSDGCGVVQEVGDEQDKKWLNKRVVINPNNDWGDNPNVQARSYHILGMPTKGTFAEYISVPVDRLVEAPKFLTDEEAGALPLGGVTAYNALMNKGQASADKKILISGVGGGVAQFAMQFAIAIGAQVWVTSSKQDVIDKCVEMGAKGGVSYKEHSEIVALSKSIKGFDTIIDSAGGEGIDTLLKSLAPNGRYVLYGATKGLPSTLNLRNIFWNQLAILGSTMGSDQDFVNMVQLVEKYQIKTIIDKVFPLERAVEAFDRIKNTKVFGKIVLRP
ncbi:MAG: zinc-binding dehydrogenase [Chitinophagales bacterium]|nr:zinc-binding dehydrogenase [Chitinophagales bacterium]